MSALRILHVMRAPVGGLFRHVRDLAAAQAARGHQVGVICDSVSGDGLTERRLAALQPHLALGLHRFPMSREISWKDPLTYLAMRQLAGRTAIDVLHGHGAKGGAFARLAGAAIDAPAHKPRTFYTPHGGSLHYAPGTLKGRVYIGIERRLLHSTDGLIFESAYAERVFAERVAASGCARRIIHNGLQDAEFDIAEPDAEAVDFLFVGELSPIKGVDLLLQALRRINDIETARALIVGDGKAAGTLRQLATALGLDGVVTFRDAMPIRDALVRGRCMVMPSRAESLPYVALETAAAGVPLIATRVGGIPEIVQASDTGLVPPGDAGALADAMQTALQAPDEARARALRLREAIRPIFSVSTMTDHVLDFYVGALDVCAGSRPVERAAR